MSTDRVRTATATDHAAVARVLEGALLEVPLDLRAACADGRVLVTGDPPVGALVVSPPTPAGGARLVAVAVTPARRGGGLGRRLVAAALERPAWCPLSATADERVHGFYAALGFACQPVGPDRIRAVRDGPYDQPSR